MPNTETTHPPPAHRQPPYGPSLLARHRAWPFPAGASIVGLSDVMIQARRIITTSARLYLNNSEH